MKLLKIWLKIKLRLMPYKLRMKRAKIFFIYYVFDDVTSKFYFMLMALTR